VSNDGNEIRISTPGDVARSHQQFALFSQVSGTSEKEPDVAPEDGEQAGKPPQFFPPHVTFATAVAGAVPEGHIL
jgi:hypothetical protein